MTDDSTPVVGVIMGSQSDWLTLEKAAQTLSEFGVKWESKVVTRTPHNLDLLYKYANPAKSRGLKCIIAGAGGAAHLPGMAAAMTPSRSGCSHQIQNFKRGGLFFPVVQMPAGVPTATFARMPGP